MEVVREGGSTNQNHERVSKYRAMSSRGYHANGTGPKIKDLLPTASALLRQAKRLARKRNETALD